MRHLRLIGAFWLVLGFAGVCMTIVWALHQPWLRYANRERGIAETAKGLSIWFVCSLFVALIGYAVIRAKRWGRICCLILSILMIGYAMACVVAIGRHASELSSENIVSSLILCFSGYSLYHLIRV